MTVSRFKFELSNIGSVKDLQIAEFWSKNDQIFGQHLETNHTNLSLNSSNFTTQII